MARYFFDTSALVKYYHDEVGSPTVRNIINEANAEFFISRLAFVEMLSGLAGKVRAGVLTIAEYHGLRRLFLGDITRRPLMPIRIIDAHYELAGELITTHALIQTLRTLDAVQLATVLRLHRATPIDHFVCADRRLCQVAAMEGLSSINPDLRS